MRAWPAYKGGLLRTSGTIEETIYIEQESKRIKMAATADLKMPTESALLSLPPELRNRIWAYAMKPSGGQSREPLIIHRSRWYDRRLMSGKSAMQPALTKVNRRIRSESLPMFYGRNILTIEYDNSGGSDRALQWLKSLGKNAKFIQELRVNGGKVPYVQHGPFVFREYPVAFQISIHEPSSGSKLLTCTSTTNCTDLGVQDTLRKLEHRLASRYDGKGKQGLSAKDWRHVVKHIDRLYGFEGVYDDY